MIAVEFFDRTPIENAISSLTTVPDKIIFIGDRTEKGGNDYALAEVMKKMENCEVIAVNSPDDVLSYLNI